MNRVTGFVLFTGLGLMLLSGANSQAADAKHAGKHRWVCTAEGFDPQQNRRQVFGDDQPTQSEARDSAESACLQQGLAVCHTQSCFQLGAPDDL